MNIFKILSTGDGKINEANVSSFIAYLLNPKADHGLGYEFLKRITFGLLEHKNFIHEQYEYEIFLEQAFKGKDNPKQIVDIVIICYSISKGSRNESYVKEFINNRKTIEKIFLIENKIHEKSFKVGQLENQLNSAKYNIDFDLHDKIYSIFITPKNKKILEEFSSTNLKNSSHIYWKSSIEDNDSVYSFLYNLIEQESFGKIEPLNTYSLHILKSFMQFIDSNFKSIKEEEKERKFDYTYTNTCKRLNEESQIYVKLTELKNQLNFMDSTLEISDPILLKPCEPQLVVNYRDVGICLYAGQKSRNSVFLVYKVLESRDLLDKLALFLKVEIKMPNYGKSAYFKDNWMKSQILISDVFSIYHAILRAKKSIDLCFSKM